jgi:hypothetical protein
MEARSQSAAHPNEMNFIFNLNAFSWKSLRLTQHFVETVENMAHLEFQSAGWLSSVSLDA